MLYLQPRIHLQEIKVAGLIEKEFAGSGVYIAGGPRGAHCCLTHFSSEIRRDRNTRGLLDHLLKAALDRALALAERENVAVGVSEDLNLDVPRPFDELLEIDPIVSEGALRFSPSRVESAGNIVWCRHYSHSLATASGSSFEQHRVPELLRDLFCFRCVGERLGCSRNYGNAIRYCKRPSRGLASQSSDCFGWWTNPDNTRITNGSREPFALGEKTVTRMNGFRASGFCDFDDPITKQIALARRGWP